jgi:replicative DNA helicase
MNNVSSKFQKKVLELVNGTNFSDAFVFDKLSELLNDNEQIAIKELKDPSNFHELLNGSISSLKIENKDFEFKSKIEDLDKISGGFGLGEFIIIGARPGMGKTKFLNYLAIQGARNFPILYFALDSGKESFMFHLLSSLTEIDYNYFQNNRLSTAQWTLIERVKADIENLPIYISDEVIKSMHAFRVLCEKYINDHGVKVIFIDFLQLLGSNRYRYQRDLELGYVSRELKNLAREKNVCIIATSQLSRSCESRGGDRKPILSDLRESGSFEQDADKILFLYRAEYYGFLEDENGISTKNSIEIDVAKNRNGYTGRATVKHNLPFGSFMPFIPDNPHIQFIQERLKELEDEDPPF